jgi:hypothetical protein
VPRENGSVAVTPHARSAALAPAALIATAAALAACGGATERTAAPDPRPADAAAYGDLPDAARAAAAAGCRDRLAERASGVAARQLASVDARLLRRELDLATSGRGARTRFERACAEAMPLVTPGLRVSFAGVDGNGMSFTYLTNSDEPLTIDGTISPAPAGGRVLARRESGRPQPISAPIDARGHFVFRDIRLRKVADNTFLLMIQAPPNAPRLVRFSALCQDCIISGSPPPPA